MFKRWLLKRRLSHFNSDKVDWEYRLHNQKVLPLYVGIELTSKALDRLSIMSRCGTVEKLVESLYSVSSAMGKRENLPKIKFISREKGEISLTKYLTTSDGYPYSIKNADGELQKVLGEISDTLERLQDTDEVRCSYYRRTLKPYITEAIEFRMLVNSIT